MTTYFVLAHDLARQRAQEAIKAAPDGQIVLIKEPTRNKEQNALLWSLLGQVSKSVIWHGNKLTSDEWKDVFSSSLKKQKVVPGIDSGSFVICGRSTSRMSKSEFSELIELIYAFGASQEVNFEL